jgi:hypothetical protein
MFDPIILRGRKIGMMICHDMFFPAVVDTLVRHGAGILVDLIGGNVNLRKWTNIIRPRSLEIGGSFICTMGHYPTERPRAGSSFYIAYEDGKKVQFGNRPLRGQVNQPIFEMVEVPAKNSISEDEEQPFSKIPYSDITISTARA